MDDLRNAFIKAGIKEPGKQENKMVSHPVASKPSPQTASLPLDYTTKADQVIIGLRQTMGRDYNNFTTSKIRNILGMVSEIYNDVLNEMNETLSADIQSRIEYLKVRLVYECGREPGVVKPFVQEAGLLAIISGIGTSRKKFIEFARYMEALVAYHRFHGGRD